MFGLRGRNREEGEQPQVVRFDLVNVALAAAIVVLVVHLFSFVDLIFHVLVVLIVAILLATGIEPLVARLRRGGISRGPSVLGIYLVIVGALVSFIVFVGRTVGEQAASFTSDAPALSRSLMELASGLPGGPIRDLASSTIASLQPERLAALLGSIFTPDTAARALSVTLTAFETIFTVVTVFVIAYFWLEERTRIRRLVARSLRPEHRERALRIWEDVEARLGAWLRGQLLLMGIIGAAQGAAYLVLGLPFPLLLAVFAGLMEAIPMVGPFLGAIPAILIALTISPQLALILAAYTVLVHLVEGNVLVPRIMEKAVGLTPLSVILALLVGASVGGAMGALLAIPVAAAVQAAIVDLISSSGPTTPTPEATEIERDEEKQGTAA